MAHVKETIYLREFVKEVRKQSRNILSDWTEIFEKCSKPSVGQELSENELNEQAAKMFCSF